MPFPAVAAMALALALAGCAEEAPPQGKLYASNVLNNTVSVIELPNPKVKKKIPVGTLPHNFVFSRDYRHLFLTNTGSQSVSVIDTVTDEVIQEVLLAPLPANATHARFGAGKPPSCASCHPNPVGTLPAGIALSPDGRDVLVASLKGPTITRMNAETFEVEQTVALSYPDQPHPSNVAYHPDRDEIYVLNRAIGKAPGRLTVLDGRLQVKRSVETIHQPFGVAIGADGRELYLASRVKNRIQVWNTDTWQVARTLPSGDGPVGLFLDLSGKLYAANFYTNRPAYLSVIDGHTGRTLRKVETAADLTMIVPDPDRRFMYMATSGANKIQILDMRTDQLYGEVPAGPTPLDVAYKPPQR